MKKIFTILLSILLVLGVVGCEKKHRKIISPILSVATVKGKVLTELKAPLPDASIHIGYEYDGKTNVSGEYSIEDVKTGTYRVIFYKTGYYEKALERVNIVAPETKIMDIILVSTATY